MIALRRFPVHAALLLTACACQPLGFLSVGLPIETSLAFTNFSKRFYAVLQVREPRIGFETASFVSSPLLAPGATYRARFLDLLETGCPCTVDLRLLLYRRVNESVPIGLDTTEGVESQPIAAGQVIGLPACCTQPLEAYTVVVWDAPAGTARVKVAQNTLVDQAIRDAGIFPSVDAVWVFDGVDPALANAAPPALADPLPIAGRVIDSQGSGVSGVGVVLRTRFRVRLNDDDPTNDPDAGFGDPIAFTETASDGTFAFARPPGAYRMEFFSDDFGFRPGAVDIETPNETVLVIAERLP